MRLSGWILSTIVATIAVSADRAGPGACVGAIASANSDQILHAGKAESQPADDDAQETGGAKVESGGRHRNQDRAADRRHRYDDHGRRRPANPGAENRPGQRRAPPGARRAGHPKRLARLGHRRIDSRRDPRADADPHRRGRSQRRRDRKLRHGQPDDRQSRSRRDFARRGRFAVRLAGDRRGGQCALAGGAGAADSEPGLGGRQSRDQRAGRDRQRRRGKSRLLGRAVVLLD